MSPDRVKFCSRLESSLISFGRLVQIQLFTAREANPIPERGMKIDQKFRNLQMAICSRTKGYCFQEQQAIVFLLFYNLKIPKQGIKMQIFFLNRLWRRP